MTEKVREVVAAYFQIDPSTLDESSGPGLVGGWDSLGQVGLVAHLEQAFGIRFDVNDVVEMDSLGSISRVVARRSS